MLFTELHELVPSVVGKRNHVLTMSPYENVTLAMPGRHQKDTDPIGMDFVVMLDDDTLEWKSHQFTHTDMFEDAAAKFSENPIGALDLIDASMAVILNELDPVDYRPKDFEYSLDPVTFVTGMQCLAVAEHRRYHRFEKKFGGRFVPLRFIAGVVEEKWTVADCINLQSKGRPGVEILEKINGKPNLTKKMMQIDD